MLALALTKVQSAYNHLGEVLRETGNEMSRVEEIKCVADCLNYKVR